jgi:tetratricopeptide (TPR) repeat protein
MTVNGLSLLAPQAASQYLPILRNPLSAENHASIAQALKEKGSLADANREAMLADDLNATSVLGDSSEPSLIQEWEKEPLRLETEFAHWKQITVTKPDYRDGYLMAGYIAYQRGEIEEAKIFIDQALRLDPTSTTGIQFQKLLESIEK